MTDADARALREYAAANLDQTNQMLAETFGYDEHTVSNVLSGKYHADAGGPLVPVYARTGSPDAHERSMRSDSLPPFPTTPRSDRVLKMTRFVDPPEPTW